METRLQESTTRELRRTARRHQREGRVPGLVAAVCRGGEVLWSDGIGVADIGEGRPPGVDDQFMVASNTKTFTAVLVMQLRDEGRLALDDLLADHLPGVTHPVTVRQALAHVSGMQREPMGDVWDTLVQPDGDELRAGFNEAERVGRPHDRWHYSNVVYAMLGQLVEAVDGRPWADALQQRLLVPLGLTRTTVGFDGGPHATGYYVPPFHDVPRPEPLPEFRAMNPVGGLASTATDLARWSAFVADPDPAVLSPDTLEEMCQPQVLTDPTRWTAAMGLGFFLMRTPTGRTYVGHDGGNPGHITSVFTHRESGTGGIALMNSTSAPDPSTIAIGLADHVVEHDPVEEEPWKPATDVPEGLVGILGRWFTEGRPMTITLPGGRLEARMDGLPADRAPSVFEQIGPDEFRTVSGRERGEMLRITRGPGGSVAHLHWATYLCTREPLAFGEHHEG
jgi:CubicO group peptidase (beta-lactamase class C family)